MLISEVLKAVGSTVEDAGVETHNLDEVRALVDRTPAEASVAVIGPHDAGKTTLIAVLTDDTTAKENISSDVSTVQSTAYRYRSENTEFVLWDTPGLGTEHLGHDRDARDRITRADAVVVAVSSDLVSQRGRDQLEELLLVGRKRGAVLLVVTKADRESVDNRDGIRRALALMFPDLGAEPAFISAGEVLDAREDDEPTPPDTGMDEFVPRLERLAVQEAQRRVTATAAIRLLVLIERAESALGEREPEQAAVLELQRRLRNVLRRTDRRILDAAGQASRKARLGALQSIAMVAGTIDQALVDAELEKTAAEATAVFVDAAKKAEEELVEALADELRKARGELERLDQGVLARQLRHTIDDLEGHEFGDTSTINVDDFAFEKGLLDAVHRAADVLKAVNVGVKELGHIGTGLDIAAELAGWILAGKEAEAILGAKAAVRQSFLAEYEKLRDRWDDHTERIRDSTTRRLLSEAERREDDLFGRLTNTREQLQVLSESRRRLDGFIDEEAGQGYVDSPPDGA